jgi:hypothetical protein
MLECGMDLVVVLNIGRNVATDSWYSLICLRSIFFFNRDLRIEALSATCLHPVFSPIIPRNVICGVKFTALRVNGLV